MALPELPVAFWLILPDLLLAGMSVFILLVAAFAGNARGLSAALAAAGLAAYILLSYGLFRSGEPAVLFWGIIRLDPFSAFFRMFFAAVTLLTLILALRSREMRAQPGPEVVSFLLALAVSMSMMASANDLLMMYLALESVSILSYVLVGFKKQSRASSEAGLKYLLYGAMASGVMIFGFSYLFGLVGSTNLDDVAAHFREIKGISTAPLTFFAALCAMTGLGFKMATFPTQMWCPDVYEGAPTPVTAFLSVGPKAAGFAMTARFFVTAFDLGAVRPAEIFQFIDWAAVFAIVSAVTMTLGNLAAIPQRNLKRLMAYSSIGHAGYLLMGLTTLSPEGLHALLFYLPVYLLMNFGAFWVIVAVADRLGTEEIEGYRGLGWRSPVLAGTLAVFLFSLTGLPPFAGFVGKYLLFGAVIQKGIYWLAVAAVLNSVVSFFYYARIIKAMYLEAPVESAPLDTPWFHRAATFLLALPVLGLGIYWEPLSRLASRSLSGLF